MSMSNKSRFISAFELLDNAEAKLANLNTIYHRAPMIDPLDNPEFGPDRTSTRAIRGGNLGKLVGGLGGAALGGLAGHAVGGAISGAATGIGDAVGSVLPTYDADTADNVHNFFQTAGGVEGALSGGIGGAWLGSHAGKRIGAGIGRMTASAEEQAAEKIKNMDPASGLAHIRMVEQSGHVSPSVIQAMKDAYNTRRSGIQTQLGTGVAIPPGRAPHQIISNRPEALPV